MERARAAQLRRRGGPYLRCPRCWAQRRPPPLRPGAPAYLWSDARSACNTCLRLADPTRAPCLNPRCPIHCPPVCAGWDYHNDELPPDHVPYDPDAGPQLPVDLTGDDPD